MRLEGKELGHRCFHRDNVCVGGCTCGGGAKEREPLRMGIESQSKRRLNLFMHECLSTQILYVTPDKYG